MTPTQLMVVVLASAAGATVKSVTGMGYPVIAVPIISLVAGVETAVMIVAIPNVAANVYMYWETRDASKGTRDLGRMVGFGSVGAVVGTIALVNLPDRPLLIMLAITILIFVVQYFRRPDLKLTDEVTKRWAGPVGFVAGCMQGAIGVSGPVVAAWFHGYRLSARTYIHSVTLVFGITGMIQLVILLAQGALTRDRAVAMAVAGVTVAAVLPQGVRLRGHLAGRSFDNLVLGAIILSAVSLLLEALT
ncbi:MAG TPA: sulfite exporter TauE/SafE family protein [Microthrixaceae bacterium]|nr:sulfite exporter TauE/SafE family protein [Microthrixaceae bacterium]